MNRSRLAGPSILRRTRNYLHAGLEVASIPRADPENPGKYPTKTPAVKVDGLSKVFNLATVESAVSQSLSPS
jgi:hypothetical protein